MFVEPRSEQIGRLSEGGAEPVFMLNLLRFRPDGGRESYARYGEGVRPLLSRIGAEVVWQGRADSVVIGDDDGDAWDLVIVVRYPSRQAFLSMISSPDYRQVSRLRHDALLDSRLIACSEVNR